MSFEILEAKPLPASDSGDLKASSEKCPLPSTTSNEYPSPAATLSVDLLQNGEKRDPVNLEEFEKKQKLIEEQNRVKKEMLGKALALRYVFVFMTIERKFTENWPHYLGKRRLKMKHKK